jgi:hypothetical protein
MFVNVLSDAWDVDIHDIAQFTLCKIGNTDGGLLALNFDPFVVFGVLKFFGNIHKRVDFGMPKITKKHQSTPRGAAPGTGGRRNMKTLTIRPFQQIQSAGKKGTSTGSSRAGHHQVNSFTLDQQGVY